MKTQIPEPRGFVTVRIRFRLKSIVTEQELIQRVNSLWPDLEVRQARVRNEGQSNDVLIVNDEWVFRFARNDAACADLEREQRIISLVREYVDMPVPESELPQRGVMRQRIICGQGLDRHTLLRQPIEVQDRLVEQLAHFLFQIHRVPQDKLEQASVGKSPASDGLSDAIALFHDCERELLPHLKSYAADVVREHFEPVLNGTLALDAPTVLIHGDLNPSHILWDSQRGKVVGVIDFGMSGFGDSALDYAAMMISYGETSLHRMYHHHRSIGEKIDRARFWAMAIELKIVLAGLRSGDPRWFCAHVGTARDILPIHAAWK